MIQAIIDKISTNTAFKLVGGAADIPTARDALTAEPAAFVLLTREQADENVLITALMQNINVGFGVLLGVRNVSDMRGEAGTLDLVELRKLIKKNLLNWQPHPDYTNIEFVSGIALGVDDHGVLWWLDEYKTSYYERVTDDE